MAMEFNAINQSNPALLLQKLIAQGMSQLTSGTPAPSLQQNAMQAGQDMAQPVGQVMGQMGQMVGRAAQGQSMLDQLRLKEAEKALKSQVKNEVQEAASHPDGLQALSAFVERQQKRQSGVEDIAIQPQQILGALLSKASVSNNSMPTGTSTEPVAGTGKSPSVTTQPSNGFFDFGGVTQDANGGFIVREPGGFAKLALLSMGKDISGSHIGNINALREMLGQTPQSFAQTPEGAGAIKKAEAEAILPSKIKEIEMQGSVDYQKEYLKQVMEADKEGTLKPNEIFTQYRKATGAWETVRDAHGRVEASASDPSPAGDLALIFNYMKVLDPGSTIREGEFATAQNSGSAFTAVGRQYNQIINGKRLTNAQRKDFVDRSRKLFKQSEGQQVKTDKQFGELARRNGIDPSRLLIDTGLSQQEQTSVSTGQTKSGNKFRRVQ